MNTALKQEYWWIILPGSLIFAWMLSTAMKYVKSKQHNAGQATSSPRVFLSTDGRIGKLHYQSPEASFDLYAEFGGGDVVAIVQLPTANQWEAATKIPLGKRAEVLQFIGKEVVAQSTTFGAGSFEIQADCMILRAH